MCHLSSWGEGAHRLVLTRTIDGEQQKKNVSHKRNARATQQVYGRILSPCLSFRLTLYPTPGTKLAGHHARVTVGAVSTSLWQRDAGVMPAWTGNYVRLLPLHSGRTSGRGKRRCRVRTVGWKRFFVEAVLGRARVTRAGRGAALVPREPRLRPGVTGDGGARFPRGRRRPVRTLGSPGAEGGEQTCGHAAPPRPAAPALAGAGPLWRSRRREGMRARAWARPRPAGSGAFRISGDKRASARAIGVEPWDPSPWRPVLLHVSQVQ